jgi:hypothetical protein
MRLILAFALVMLSWRIASAQPNDAYVCIPDKATGFSFNRQARSWEYARFSVKDEKYLLSREGDSWRWKRMGAQHVQQCHPFTELGYTQCIGFSNVTFNRTNLRYMLVYQVGYVQAGISDEEGKNEPYMEIGRCSKL